MMQSLPHGLLSLSKDKSDYLIDVEPIHYGKEILPQQLEAIASAPAEFFKEIEYDEFMDWRVLN